MSEDCVYSTERDLRNFLRHYLSKAPPPPPNEPEKPPTVRRWAAKRKSHQPAICWRHPNFILLGEAPVREPPRTREAPSAGERSYAHSDKNGHAMLSLKKWQGKYFEELEADPLVAHFLANPVSIRLKSRRLFKPDFYVRRDGQDWFVDCVREAVAATKEAEFERVADECVSFGVGYEAVTDEAISAKTRVKNVRMIRRARFDGVPTEDVLGRIASLLLAGPATLEQIVAADPSLSDSDLLNAIAARRAIVDLDMPHEQWLLLHRHSVGE